MTSEQQIKNSLAALHDNGIIAFPSEVGWQLVCDALDEQAVSRLKATCDFSPVSIILAAQRDVLQYVAAPDPAVFDYFDTIDHPTTIVFENGIGLATNALNVDGSVSIRLVKDDFTKHLIKRFGKPLAVADLAYTNNSINVNTNTIDPNWHKLCDYLVESFENQLPFKTASWIKWIDGPTPMVIRP